METRCCAHFAGSGLGMGNSYLSRSIAWVVRNLPTREQLEKNRFLRPFAARVLRPELWRFTRRSVPRGVALGMLVGIIIPIAQIVLAAIFALPVRANVPVATLTTFITNPFTTPLIWVLSYNVGAFILRVDAMTYGSPIAGVVHNSQLGEWIQWLTGAALVTAFGIVIVGIISAAVSYLLSVWGWRWWVARKWRTRHIIARTRS
jgi:uncharacterized protein